LARHHKTVPFQDMISHRFSINDAALAVQTSMDPENSTKVLITESLL
jgi:threonine dehydrogenase-like Zn-dependent dehydrogenase